MSVAKKLLQNAPAEFMNRDRVLVDVEVIREAADTITAQAAEIARLREALKPFAEMSPLDIFRARAALEAGNE